jgi:hypothetical protein
MGFFEEVKVRPSLARSPVSTSTANTVAVVRTFPAMDMSASDTGKWCSANPYNTITRQIQLINFGHNRFKSHGSASFRGG